MLRFKTERLTNLRANSGNTAPRTFRTNDCAALALLEKCSYASDRYELYKVTIVRISVGLTEGIRG